ncbi:MAG: site-specific integrase [Chloroflexota bacterium]
MTPVQKARGRRTLPRYITETECKRIIEAAECERDRLLLRLMFESGSRVSEVCPVRRRDIDIEVGQVRLVNLKQGTYAEKLCVVSMELAKMLDEYCTRNSIGEDGYVFPSKKRSTPHIGRKMVYRIVTQLTEKLGIRKPHADGISSAAWPHCLRHGAAVNILTKTKNIQLVKQQLGHASVSTTGIYTELVDDERVNQLRSVFR